MYSVPLVIIGVALALTITLTPLSVRTFIGLIVLAGIVVKNAIPSRCDYRDRDRRNNKRDNKEYSFAKRITVVLRCSNLLTQPFSHKRIQ
ncbi:RND multidrug efflux transporter [Halalkalibacter akibai JCM 9157]|uniref:RND multidrug efflux transporter n=2 Tax=Halalkalibacter akibai TaxID=1411 RepID=W4QUX8_HALA3|nr:RND multidrug efflux transporter [Halalkalibacter akibai JCM 9157]